MEWTNHYQLGCRQRIIDVCERSVFQLLEQFVMGEKNVPKAYRSTAKAHANLFKRTFCQKFIFMNQKLWQESKNGVE